MIERDRRKVERRIKGARRIPVVKSLDSFDFTAIPTLNKMQVLELARYEWIERRENVIALGPSGLTSSSPRSPAKPVFRDSSFIVPSAKAAIPTLKTTMAVMEALGVEHTAEVRATYQQETAFSPHEWGEGLLYQT
jgi:hypothetical protein